MTGTNAGQTADCPSGRVGGVPRRRFLAGAGLGIAGAAFTGPAATAAARGGSSAATGDSLDYPLGPFQTSTAALTERMNEYWAIYGTAQGTPQTQGALKAGALALVGGNPAWDEWDALKFSWTNHGGHRDLLVKQFPTINRINGVAGTTGAQPDGYLWSWTNLETWPDNNAFHHGLGSYHFEQLPRFVTGVCLLTSWSRDGGFLAQMLPRVESVMDRYLLTVLHGDRTVLTTPSRQPNGTISDGTSAGRPSNYMDEMRAGHQDAWASASFYTALQAMADLERLAGRLGRAERYAALARAFPDRYSDVFWNPATNRYAGWVDATGTVHDYGLTFVNLEAVARGLASEEQADAVLNFLTQPAEPTSGIPKPACNLPASAHPGSTVAYQDVYGPRSTTHRLPDTAWDGWSDPSCGRRPYGAGLEEGGSFLWECHYDILARLRSLDADAALDTFTTMLARVHSDSQRLTMWYPGRTVDDFGESFVEVGTNSPFPESGISVLPVVYGFLGLRAAPSGLEVTPALPHSLLSLAAGGVSYGTQQLTVHVSRADILREQSTGASPVPTDAGPLMSAPFSTTRPFNEIGILTSGPIAPSPHGSISISLEREKPHGWQTVQTRRRVPVTDQDWLVIDVPEQHGNHQYRIVVRDGTAGTGWYQNSTGQLTFRAIHAPQRPISVCPYGRGPIRFHTAVPFDRIVLHSWASQFVATLSRRIGANLRPRHEHAFADLDHDGNAVMGFASQPPGVYQLDVHGAPVVAHRLEQEQYTLTVPEVGLHTTVPAGDRHLIRSA